MRIKHTPGPWAIHFLDFAQTTYTKAWLINADQPIVLHEESAESEANAHLIAAAPELLEACMKASAYLGHLESAEGNVRIAKALLDEAILKAKV